MKTNIVVAANSGWLALATLTGCLALSEPLLAEDAIHYVHPESGIYFEGHTIGPNGEPAFLPLDLNGDGIIDFKLGDRRPDLEGSCYLFAQSTNEMVVQEEGLSPLPDNALIGLQLRQGHWLDSNATYKVSGWGAFISSSVTFSPDWITEQYGIWFGKEAYAGVKFYIDGQPHYGWIHIQHEPLESALTVVDWAYSTQPNAPILAGAIGEVTMEPPKVRRPGYLRLQWPSTEGFTYQIQVKNSMADSGWTSLDFLLPGTGTNTLVDVRIGASERYYRVLKLE